MTPITSITVDGVEVDLSALPADQFTVDDETGNTVAVRCQGCDEWYSDEDWQNESMIGELTEVALCETCYTEDTTYPSTLMQIPDNVDTEIDRTVFGDHTYYADSGDEWFLEFVPADWTGRKYVSTDGWRGYYDTSAILDGLSDVENGWVTGDYGDVPWKRDTHTFFQRLEARTLVPPVELYILFEPTSNVFSTACTIMARDEDVDTVREWLAGLDLDLHGALG